MFNNIKKFFLKRKFVKQFVSLNKHTIKAFTLKSDEDFNKLFMECINDIAKKNKKDIKSISLEDIYRVLHKIRQKTPKILRKITLYQIMKLKEFGSQTSDFLSIFHSILRFTPLPLIYVGLKKLIGKRVEYVFKIYIVSIIAKEIYGGGSNESN